MALRHPVAAQPDRKPNEACRAGDDESETPAPLRVEQHDQGRRDDRASRSCRINQPVRESTFPWREPFRDRFLRCEEIPGLADSQKRTVPSQSHGPSRQRVHGVSGRPPNHRDSQSDSSPPLVDEASEDHEHSRVADEEGLLNACVLDIGEAQIGGDFGRKHREGLAVGVVDQGGCEQQRRDTPADVLTLSGGHRQATR